MAECVDRRRLRAPGSPRVIPVCTFVRDARARSRHVFVHHIRRTTSYNMVSDLATLWFLFVKKKNAYTSTTLFAWTYAITLAGRGAGTLFTSDRFCRVLGVCSPFPPVEWLVKSARRLISGPTEPTWICSKRSTRIDE